MSEELDRRIADLRAWMLMHLTRDAALYLQDRICSEYGLTAEQYALLVAVKHLDDPVRPTDIGRWGGHKASTVSLLADRMVNAGPLERIRDLPDRREIRLTITMPGVDD